MLTRRIQLVVLFAFVLLVLAPAAEEKRLAIYSPQTNFTVNVTDHEGREYVSLTDLLDPFGQATLTPGGKRWRLKFTTANGTTIEGEFTEDSTQAKLRGKKLTLVSAFWSNNDRGYIPVGSTNTVLAQLLGLGASLRESSRRLFVGDVATTYSFEMQKTNPPKLVLHFSSPVNPSVSTEPGRVRLSFTRDPLVASAGSPQALDDLAIHSATFSESNGSAEITFATSAPVLATFGDNNRTITLAPAPSQVAQVPSPATAPQTQTPAATVPPSTPTPSTPVPAPPRFLVAIDPAHGGDDPGAALGDGLFEKEVTLSIARRIRADLDQRGIAAVLLRDGDTTLSLDQRAAAANASRAGIYIAVHASTSAPGVRLYSSRGNGAPITAKRGFLPWDTAQAAYLDQSHTLAASAIAELESRHVGTVPFESGLRPLRNIAKPAIAIEVGPPPDAPDGLTSASYQQLIAAAIGAGVANVRANLESAR